MGCKKILSLLSNCINLLTCNHFVQAKLKEKAQPMMIVSGEKMETSSVIPVIGGNAGGLVGSIKNVMEEDPSILQVKQEDIGLQESPFVRIMG